jgi:capsular polysaccharide transport system permease protein
MSVAFDQRPSLREALRTQWRILLALMLRDVRTRFFGTALGFVIATGWPLANIFILLAINTIAGRAAPYGTSAALWFATGLVPFMAFQYMARFTMLGIVMNKPLLGLPVVKVMDIMLARALLEVLNAGLVVVLSILIFCAMGLPFMPTDLVQAFCAMGACMFLGAGFGLINGVVAGLYSFWATVYALFTIVLWIASAGQDLHARLLGRRAVPRTAAGAPGARAHPPAMSGPVSPRRRTRRWSARSRGRRSCVSAPLSVASRRCRSSSSAPRP